MTQADTSWRANLVTSWPDIEALLTQVKRVAVLGIKTEAQSDQPAFYVADALARAGLDVVPVPTYYPEVTEILGRKVYRKLSEIPGEIDLVNIFRRPVDVAGHVDDIVAKRPRIVWLQSGIRNDAAAEQMARAGIKVVQDRCLMVDYGRLSR